jgi:hypothetical protein
MIRDGARSGGYTTAVPNPCSTAPSSQAGYVGTGTVSQIPPSCRRRWGSCARSDRWRNGAMRKCGFEASTRPYQAKRRIAGINGGRGGLRPGAVAGGTAELDVSCLPGRTPPPEEPCGARWHGAHGLAAASDGAAVKRPSADPAMAPSQSRASTLTGPRRIHYSGSTRAVSTASSWGRVRSRGHRNARCEPRSIAR